MKTIRLVVIIFFAIITFVYAQGSLPKFQIDFNEINGELTEKDLVKKEFGRYDGYEIELFKGETINFIVYTKDFQPSLALVNSKGEIFQQSQKNDQGFANIIGVMPNDGDWVLYVIGDEKANGRYTLQMAIGAPNSLELKSDSDFCTSLEYFVAHSYAYFLLLENLTLNKQKLARLNNSLDAFLDENNGAYNAFYYGGNDLSKAEEEFENLTKKINFCLGTAWRSESSNWKIIEDYKEKSITFTEKTDKQPRFIVVSIYEFPSNSKKYNQKYNVSLEINRLH